MKQEANLSRRVMAHVKRGLTDETAVVVWQHEIPILEEIHGEGNVSEVTAEAAKGLDAGYKAKKGDLMKLPPSVSIGLGEVFDGEPAVEYERLVQLYGMHPKVEMPMVEKVYGRFKEGKFSAIIGKPELSQLGIRQLRARCIEEEIPVPPKAKPAELAKLIQSQEAA